MQSWSSSSSFVYYCLLEIVYLQIKMFAHFFRVICCIIRGKHKLLCKFMNFRAIKSLSVVGERLSLRAASLTFPFSICRFCGQKLSLIQHKSHSFDIHNKCAKKAYHEIGYFITKCYLRNATGLAVGVSVFAVCSILISF